MAAPWGVLSEAGGRVTVHVLEDDRVCAHDFASAGEAAERSGIPAARLIALDPALRSMPPVATLPNVPGALGAVQQAAPAALLPPAARILIAGALMAEPDWDGIIILPEPDQTHWVHVSAREIISFQGAATGRIAAAFGVDDAAFSNEALGDTMARPERLATHLNAAALTGDGAALLGHLLGAELAAMRPYWLGQQVRIITDAAPYAAALSLQGVEAQTVARAPAWQAGLVALRAAMGFSG